jgi:hypothetical protein
MKHVTIKRLLRRRLRRSFYRRQTAWHEGTGIEVTKRLLMIDDEVGLTKVVGLIAAGLDMEFKALNMSLGHG